MFVLNETKKNIEIFVDMSEDSFFIQFLIPLNKKMEKNTKTRFFERFVYIENVFIYICIAFMHGTSAFREIRIVLTTGYIYDNVSDSISKLDKRIKRDLCNLKVKNEGGGGTFIFAPVPNFFAFICVSLKRKRTMRLVKTDGKCGAV